MAVGVDEILWVDGGGIEGDDTDGHIDQLARFVSPNTIVVAVSSRQEDSNHAGLAENLHYLQKYQNSRGQHFDVIPLPTPAPRMSTSGECPRATVTF